MGKDATASLSYGFIIPQPKVLEVLQNLQNSTEKVEEFGYGNGVELLEKLLLGHLNERFEGEFDMVFLTAGDYDFEGLAILYKGVGKRVTVWGFGSEKFEPLLSGLWDNEQVEDANNAFKRLGEDSLFEELEIRVNPGWLLGNNMTC